jgi:hypothetical protein
MRRRLLNLLTMLSLLLCLAVCAVWVRSYWVEDRLVWRRFDPPGPYVHAVEDAPRMTDVLLTSGWGHLWVSVDSRYWYEDLVTVLDLELGGDDEVRWSRSAARPPARSDSGFWGRLGFRTHWHAPSPGDRLHRMRQMGVGLPLWAVALPLAAAPVARLLRRRRIRVGHCPACGYDLRATPERCPECGGAASVSSGR